MRDLGSWCIDAVHVGPNPLPEGEGTERGVCPFYADQSYRAELKL